MDVSLPPRGKELHDFAFLNIRLGTVDGGEHGLLVMKSDQLIAVLTQVDEEQYAVKSGWFLETGFGRLGGCHRMFETLDEATIWIAGQFEPHERSVPAEAYSVC